VSSAEFDPGREAAMLEVLAGYQCGLGKLHPGDHEEYAWFLDRLRDLWTIVGHSPVEPVPSPDAPIDRCADPLLGQIPTVRWQRESIAARLKSHSVPAHDSACVYDGRCVYCGYQGFSRGRR
jgi:hypothetical protein